MKGGRKETKGILNGQKKKLQKKLQKKLKQTEGHGKIIFEKLLAYVYFFRTFARYFAPKGAKSTKNHAN